MEFLKAVEQRDFNKQMREKATRVSENALWLTIYGGIGLAVLTLIAAKR